MVPRGVDVTLNLDPADGRRVFSWLRDEMVSFRRLEEASGVEDEATSLNAAVVLVICDEVLDSTA